VLEVLRLHPVVPETERVVSEQTWDFPENS
jgi:hypothetical protein